MTEIEINSFIKAIRNSSANPDALADKCYDWLIEDAKNFGEEGILAKGLLTMAKGITIQ